MNKTRLLPIVVQVLHHQVVEVGELPVIPTQEVENGKPD
jgi:hypothetical protein